MIRLLRNGAGGLLTFLPLPHQRRVVRGVQVCSFDHFAGPGGAGGMHGRVGDRLDEARRGGFPR